MKSHLWNVFGITCVVLLCGGACLMTCGLTGSGFLGAVVGGLVLARGTYEVEQVVVAQ